VGEKQKRKVDCQKFKSQCGDTKKSNSIF